MSDSLKYGQERAASLAKTKPAAKKPASSTVLKSIAAKQAKPAAKKAPAAAKALLSTTRQLTQKTKDAVLQMQKSKAPTVGTLPPKEEDEAIADFFSDEWILTNALTTVPGIDKVDPKNIPTDLKQIIEVIRRDIKTGLTSDFSGTGVGSVVVSAIKNGADNLLSEKIRNALGLIAK